MDILNVNKLSLRFIVITIKNVLWKKKKHTIRNNFNNIFKQNGAQKQFFFILCNYKTNKWFEAIYTYYVLLCYKYTGIEQNTSYIKSSHKKKVR